MTRFEYKSINVSNNHIGRLNKEGLDGWEVSATHQVWSYEVGMRILNLRPKKSLTYILKRKIEEQVDNE